MLILTLLVIGGEFQITIVKVKILTQKMVSIVLPEVHKLAQQAEEISNGK
jgi:hypothetical protein